MDVVAEPSVVYARFGFILLLPMSAGVAVLEAAVLVSVWDAWAAPAISSEASHPTLSVGILGEIKPGG